MKKRLNWALQALEQDPEQFLEAGKGKKMGVTPRASRKEHSPADTLILTQSDTFWSFNLQNCKKINLCCFKPLSL